ncbi:YggT family protein [Coxiella endosymbiont of Ornithodoros maritimus]|uniref:YggT family protein n=1 Tax=Coxiella endosymbiont of Ornithodoros maritimus TaxID=1656172 RepID=UPI002264D42E|nr:YggT family protein [Coxiella endosymbiont of Ornithodoros maritimus]
MMTAFTNAGIFLVGLIFNLYIIILMLRLLMQKLGVSYYNPISQVVIRLTNIFVSPLQRIIPGFKGFDLAIILLLILLEFIQVLLLFWLGAGYLPKFSGLVIIVIARLGNKFLKLYFYAIILRVVMSWIASLQHNPIAEIIFLITEPLMRPIRRLIPSIAGFDFSPIVLLILLELISILVFRPLIEFGMQLALM